MDQRNNDAAAAFDEDAETNPSNNPHFQDILEARLSRRDALKGGLGVAAGVVLGNYAVLGSEAHAAVPGLNFNPVAKNLDDIVTVPAGYRVDVLYALGDPIRDATPRRTMPTTAATAVSRAAPATITTA